MIDVAALLDALDVAVARAQPVVTPEDIEQPAAAARDARRREGFLGGTLLVAIAGGTGSGKSSLLNALAGSVVSAVSPVRPHTDEALAWVPADAEPNLADLLTGYGITRRVSHDDFSGLAVIDLPDHDSIVADHRATVGNLLPKVDGVIWVLDPEKYRDPVLYDEYLGPLRGYQRQFVFVLNQIDRLGGDTEYVLGDAATALRESGIDEPALFATAAAPTRGMPRGIEALRAHLKDRLDAKQLALGKLVADVRSVAAMLTVRAGLEAGASLDFDERWAEVRSATIDGLRSAADPAARADTRCRLEDFVAALSVEVGGPVGRRARVALGPEVIEQHLDRAAAELADVPPPPPRGRFRRAAAVAGEDAAVAASLDQHIAGPLRELLWDRAVLGAALAGLAVELARAEAALADAAPAPEPQPATQR